MEITVDTLISFTVTYPDEIFAKDNSWASTALAQATHVSRSTHTNESNGLFPVNKPFLYYLQYLLSLRFSFLHIK